MEAEKNIIACGRKQKKTRESVRRSRTKAGCRHREREGQNQGRQKQVEAERENIEK